jgi:phospholipase/carboxylesterase
VPWAADDIISKGDCENHHAQDRAIKRHGPKGHRDAQQNTLVHSVSAVTFACSPVTNCRARLDRAMRPQIRRADGLLMMTAVLRALMVVFFGVAFASAGAEERAIVSAERRILALPDGAMAALPALGGDQTSLPPLIILLHGAGQTAADMIARFTSNPDCATAVLLAPKSLGPTWDVVGMAELKAIEGASLSSDRLRYSNSKDAGRVMAAMAALAQAYPTDPRRSMLLGFSDGASFALALGTGRDRPFTSVVAISPGLVAFAARPARGRNVLILHGRKDHTLSFDFTRSTIVPALRSAGLSVKFLPFDGGHDIPDDVLATAK